MSYTLQTTTLARSNSNVEFQGWGKQISDAIANCGLVRESDANVGTQINWGTVAAPSANNQSRGYEIYKFNDAMQATTPVYFKIEYGSGAPTISPSIWLTVGSGANASGNVTGNTTTRQQLFTGAVASVTSYYSGANNRFTMIFGSGGTVAQQMHLGMERTLDSNGAVTSDGLAFLLGYSTSRFQTLWTPATGNVVAWETSASILSPGTDTGSGFPGGSGGGDHVAAYPIFFNQGAKWFPLQTMILGAFEGNFTRGTYTYIPVYGANVAYMMHPGGNTSLYFLSGNARGGNKMTLLMRWD